MRIAGVRPRWGALLLVAIGLRVIAGLAFGDVAQRSIYVVALWLLVAFVAANLALPAAPLLGLGLLLNAAVISANGGAMPISAEALAAAEAEPISDVLHRRLDESTALPMFADVIPVRLFRGVYSAGDVALSVGAGIFIFLTMTRRD